MDENKETDLRKAIEELKARNALRALSAVFPESAKQLVNKGICLFCEETLADARRVIRGCHERCHRTLLRAMESGSVEEFDLITAGKLAPKSVGGRPQSKLRAEIVSKAREAEMKAFDKEAKAESKKRQLKAKSAKGKKAGGA